MEIGEQIRNRTPILLVVVSFIATFSNSYIYLFGNNTQVETVINYAYLLIVLYASIYYTVFKRQRSQMWLFDKRVKYFIPLLLWIAIKSISTSIFGADISIKLIYNFLTIYVITMGIKKSSDFKYGFYALAVGSIASAIIPLTQHPELFGIRIVNFQGIEYSGGYWNGPSISFTSIGWLLLAFYNKENISKRGKIFSLIVFALLFVTGMAGLSRASLIAAILGAISVVFLSKSMAKKFRYVLSFILVFILILIVNPDTFASIIDRLPNSFSEISEESRVGIWSEYISNIKHYILIGATADYRNYGPSLLNIGPHSVFLNWLVQYGILGIMGFFYLIKGFIAEIKTVYKIKSIESSFMLAWMVAYIAFSTIGETGFYELSYYAAFAYVLNWSKSIKEQPTN